MSLRNHLVRQRQSDNQRRVNNAAYAASRSGRTIDSDSADVINTLLANEISVAVFSPEPTSISDHTSNSSSSSDYSSDYGD